MGCSDSFTRYQTEEEIERDKVWNALIRRLKSLLDSADKLSVSQFTIGELKYILWISKINPNYLHVEDVDKFEAILKLPREGA